MGVGTASLLSAASNQFPATVVVGIHGKSASRNHNLRIISG